tara:strand:- start:3905 stop:5140 length:1236 start_codon:yes stop_codon:yes gene_type:complete
MKNYLSFLVFLLILFLPNTSLSQDVKEKGKFFKILYQDFLKYGTVYGAGDISNSIEAEENTYFVRTNEDGSLYSIPDVVDNTPDYPFDYRIGIGIRKLARFSYERKPKNFYDGTEEQLTFSAPTSALKGLEYQLHWENERWRGEDFQNHRLFIKHTGKYHIVKAESREVDKINLEYVSGEVRARLPIGKKFSISAGAIYRTHERAYGYNPIEIWLNETETYYDQYGNPFEGSANPWYTLGFEYGYTDHFTEYTDINTGVTTQDWIWKDADGNIVAYTDLEFRENVFTDLMNRYNNEKWEELDDFAEVAPIVGFDFYHYKGRFWLHAYGNYILPYHTYIQGNKDFSYLQRESWGKGGHNNELADQQWDDYSAGLNMGWKINKHLGVFMEGEYSKMWDSELFQTTFGLNYTFK